MYLLVSLGLQKGWFRVLLAHLYRAMPNTRPGLWHNGRSNSLGGGLAEGGRIFLLSMNPLTNGGASGASKADVCKQGESPM